MMTKEELIEKLKTELKVYGISETYETEEDGEIRYLDIKRNIEDYEKFVFEMLDNYDNEEFKENDLVVYIATDRDGKVYKTEIGRFKRYSDDKTHAFVYYHSGDTASCTAVNNLYPLNNPYYVKTCLGRGESYE